MRTEAQPGKPERSFPELSRSNRLRQAGADRPQSDLGPETDLLALMRQKPGVINVTTSGAGSVPPVWRPDCWGG